MPYLEELEIDRNRSRLMPSGRGCGIAQMPAEVSVRISRRQLPPSLCLPTFPSSPPRHPHPPHPPPPRVIPPPYNDYQKKVPDREIPVVVLDPVN